MSQKKLRQIRKQIVVENPVLDNIEKHSVKQILKDNWKFLVLLSIGIFLLFFNALNGNFVSDDYATIPNNPNVLDVFDTLGDMPSFVTLSNSILANIFGVGSSIPFHVYSLLVYLIICVLSFIFVYLLFGKKVAYFSTLLFACLPIHVEAVSWISGKPYIFSTMFMLAGLCNFLLFLKTKKRLYLWLLILFEILAVFSDRVRFLSLFLIIIGYLLTYWKRHNINIGKFLMIIAGVLVLSFIYLAPSIINRVGIVNSGYNVSEGIFYNPFFQYPTSVAKYLQLIFVPIDLTLYHTMYILPVWLNWMIIISYLVCLVYFYFKNKNIFFSLAFIFLAAAPSMAPVKVSWLVAERYMFFGSLGFCMFLAIILNDISNRFKYVAPSILVVMLVLYSTRIFFRNIDWQTNHNLWVNTCQVSPNSHNAWNNIGDDYDKLKQYDNAIKGFTQSTIVKPNYADAFHNRANIFYKIGRLDMARDSYNTAISFSPGLYQTYLSLVQIDLTERKLDLALVHAKKALELQPNNPQAAYVLGIVYAEAGQIDEAKKIMIAVTQNYPGFQLAADALKKLNEIKK